MKMNVSDLLLSWNAVVLPYSYSWSGVFAINCPRYFPDYN